MQTCINPEYGNCRTRAHNSRYLPSKNHNITWSICEACYIKENEEHYKEFDKINDLVKLLDTCNKKLLYVWLDSKENRKKYRYAIKAMNYIYAMYKNEENYL